jgi:hypothetical protein
MQISQPPLVWRSLVPALAAALAPGLIIAAAGSLARCDMALIMNLGLSRALLISMAVGAMRDTAPFWLALTLLLLARPGSWPFRMLGLLAQAVFLASLLCISASWLSYHTSQSRLNPELLEYLNWDVLKSFLGSGIGLELSLVLVALALMAWYFHHWLGNWETPRMAVVRPWLRALALGLCADGLFMLWWDVNLFQASGTAVDQAKITETVAHAKIPFLVELAASPIVEVPATIRYFMASSGTDEKALSFFPYPEPYTAAERRTLGKLGLTPVGAPGHTVLATAKARNALLPAQDPVYTRVVLILVESLNRDYLHTYNHQIPPQTSAFMDSLLKKYPHLDNYCTSMSPTDFGMYALYHSRLDNDPTLFFHMEYLHDNLISLAAQRGYATWMVGGSSWFFQNHINLYPQFFHFSHNEAQESIRRHFPEEEGRLWTWGYPDDVVFKDAARILAAQHNRRTLMVVKLCNTHNPYYCDTQGPAQPQQDGQARDKILSAVRSDDQAIAGFLADLSQKGLWDDHTLVILTADHSPAFAVDSANVLRRPFEPLDRVPMVFISPNLRPWKKLAADRLSCQLDLAPTLLPLMGATAPAYFMGRDLLAAQGPGCAVGSFNGQLSLRAPDGTHRMFKRDPTDSEAADADLAESALRKWVRNYQSAAVFGRKAWNPRRPNWQYSGAD